MRRKREESEEKMGFKRDVCFLSLAVVFASLLVRHWLATPSDPQEAFIHWFNENGGCISPKVTLTHFGQDGNGLVSVSGSVSKNEKILVIPAKLQILATSISSHIPQTQLNALVRGVNSVIPSPLEQQDVLIALKLMLECSLGPSSFHYPYMELLPDAVPRLDTFQADELHILQDSQLHRLARFSLSQLEKVFTEPVQTVVLTATSSMGVSPDLVQSCCSFSSFHRFVALASSRSMILDGVKHLTPMADMINHAPREETVGDTFLSYHRLDDSGAIHVAADRSVPSVSQIHEEYGTLDNSLYLLAFRFVPVDNPHHCATIPADYLPEIDDASVQRAAEVLGTHREPICVNSEGSLLEESDYLLLFSLQHYPDRLEKCTIAVKSGDNQQVKNVCLSKSNDDRMRFQTILIEAANAVLRASSTTLKEDRVLLLNIQEGEDARIQKQLALRYRIEEKKVLHELVNRMPRRSYSNLIHELV